MVGTANALWQGSLKEGMGDLTTGSTVLQDVPYSFRTRFEGAPGTNPEELIAAAHSGCFAMALSGQLGERGVTADGIHVKADVTMENLVIRSSHLTVRVVAPGADSAAVQEAAETAKSGCPVSKVLNTEITMELTIDV